jgi:hypothetical protein
MLVARKTVASPPSFIFQPWPQSKQLRAKKPRLVAFMTQEAWVLRQRTLSGGSRKVALEIRELSTMDATAQAELVRRKELTPLELVDAAIARIERVRHDELEHPTPCDLAL